MSRYIDADALGIGKADRKAFEKPEYADGWNSAIKIIEEAPTADVVDVVRCKDCKFWGLPHANDIEKSHYCCRDNMWCMPLRFADDFCSYGERNKK